MVQEAVAKKLKGKEFFGHPAGLFILFFSEMWERMSYYGMRALLVLYMTDYLLNDPEKAKTVLGYEGLKNWLASTYPSTVVLADGALNIQAISSHIYGLYTAFVYFTPFFGGMLADRILGQKKTVYLGGILMAVGHFLMASEEAFLLALIFLIIGNGAFKPNISTQVGNLYPPGDSRRDSAFMIFYMGINLGAFFSPLICGTLGQVVGWHWGFGAAGVGMLLGLVIYYLGEKALPQDALHNALDKGEKVNRPLTSDEWKRVWALIALCLLNIVFWALFEQQGNTMQIWADKQTDFNIFGWEMPSTWYQSFNPAFIFIFTPLMIMWWRKQAAVGKEPSTVAKMGIGCFLCGASFIIMVIAAKVVPEGEKGSMLWLTLMTLVITWGELFLSPIGLSMVTKVAPAPILSMMMGMWFLSSFFGNYLSGLIGSYYEVLSKDSFFLLLTGMGILTGIIFFLFKNPLKRLIGYQV